jgi:hypothetical protein
MVLFFVGAGRNDLWGAYPFQRPLEGVGPENQEFLWALKWLCHLGTKKSMTFFENTLKVLYLCGDNSNFRLVLFIQSCRPIHLKYFSVLRECA